MAGREPIRIKGHLPALAGVPTVILRRAMPKVVAAVVDSAKREAPKDRGESSKKSIVSRIRGRVTEEGGQPGGVVKASAPHSHLIELGVKPHSLAGGASNRGQPRRKRLGKTLNVYGAGSILRQSAWHPGVRPNPFMDRATPGATGAVDRILAQEGARALQDAVNQAADVVGRLVG